MYRAYMLHSGYDIDIQTYISGASYLANNMSTITQYCISETDIRSFSQIDCNSYNTYYESLL